MKTVANVATWTDERIELLKALWSEGLSCEQIAQKIGGITRNAVIGKGHRLGLPHRARPTRATFRPRTTVVRRVAQKKPAEPHPWAPKENNSGRRLAHSRLKPMGEAAPSVVFDASAAKPWTERRFGECAYPISGEGGDTFSCCQPAKDNGYCAAHSSVMFVAPPKGLERMVKRAAA